MLEDMDMGKKIMIFLGITLLISVALVVLDPVLFTWLGTLPGLWVMIISVGLYRGAMFAFGLKFQGFNKEVGIIAVLILIQLLSVPRYVSIDGTIASTPSQGEPEIVVVEAAKMLGLGSEYIGYAVPVAAALLIMIAMWSLSPREIRQRL